MMKPAILAICAAAALACCLPAAADLQFDEGRWRLELSGGTGIHSGQRDRTGDQLYEVNIEYEFPATQHMTLGLRLYPSFVYAGPDTVWGAGAGLSAKLYQKPDYHGLFVEAFGNGIGHTPRFEGNSSSFNFLIGAGLGYRFQNDWHVTLKYEHISNASIGDRNQGINTVGL
ncbi:MAG: acyloxyacyl hydrolase, partial [Candidatus Hydrogenedentes bacterium]|nr:acyloxyacyl hydrolase [Candidatus Hydrogenedentota bacterium]